MSRNEAVQLRRQPHGPFLSPCGTTATRPAARLIRSAMPKSICLAAEMKCRTFLRCYCCYLDCQLKLRIRQVDRAPSWATSSNRNLRQCPARRLQSILQFAHLINLKYKYMALPCFEYAKCHHTPTSTPEPRTHCKQQQC